MKNSANSFNQLRQVIAEAEQKYGRQPGSVKLLAVTKTRPFEDISSAIDCGQTDFAENYVQEALGKITAINDPRLTWHFIGPIQSNKTRVIAENFHWVHSLDRAKIAQRLNDMRPDQLPPINICIQINISHEQNKSGIHPDALKDMVQVCTTLPRLRLRGLMTLPAPSDDFDQQRIPFRQLKEIFDVLNLSYPALDTLSMGTSHDMEAAIAEGSTMVRIGTALFGPRDYY
ncbi:MAG: YggS family pyridoxal phosphate-dependent enzyme [Gammaproteobacteria bacterium]|nr:YggS family pyridoxal phosphate-dependent enzyme [Gammaproteobacteria bacterium]